MRQSEGSWVTLDFLMAREVEKEQNKVNVDNFRGMKLEVLQDLVQTNSKGLKWVLEAKKFCPSVEEVSSIVKGVVYFRLRIPNKLAKVG
jgi:hypothetical protein